MHLAGVMAPDERSTWQAVRDSYERYSAGEILRNKLDNAAILVGRTPLAWRGDGARVAQREYLWNAIGLLNIGWISAMFWLISGRRRGEAGVPYAGGLLGLAACNLFVWCALLFGPGQTMTEHGSYADLLLLSLGLAGFVLTLPGAIRVLVVAGQAANLVLVWAIFRPRSFVLPTREISEPRLQWPMLALAILTGGAMLAYSVKSELGEGLTAPVSDALFEEKAQ
jgi:hypothetical protein